MVNINIKNWPLLKELALRIFTLMCRSSATERSFSEQGFIQNDRRMSLQADRIGDLTYVRANTRAIEANNDSSMIPDLDDIMSVDSSDCTD